MMDSINRPLPKSVTLPSEPITKSSPEDVNDFVMKSLPNNRSGEIRSLKDRHQLLDAVREKWKRNSKKRVRNIISSKDRRKLKVFDIKKDGHKFENYIPLHRLWQDYMRDTLGELNRLKEIEMTSLKNRQQHERLLRADYHGCMMVVKKTNCPSLLGQAGIVLMETRGTFKIITKQDQVKCIPKRGCVFAFELGGIVFSLYGNQFYGLASERIKKTFKIKATIDLT